MNINEQVYRDARSTRPAWANALIVAAVIAVAAMFFTVWNGSAMLLWIAAGVALLVAGVLALTRVKRAG